MPASSTVLDFLGADHARCDTLFEQAAAHAERQAWPQAQAAFGQFRSALECHIAMEESVLFIEFEQATGMTSGPTAVMRMEHAQMREVMQNMAETLQQRAGEAYLGHAQALQILMGQHNLKEESVLYPMADRALSGRREQVLLEMARIPAATLDGA